MRVASFKTHINERNINISNALLESDIVNFAHDIRKSIFFVLQLYLSGKNIGQVLLPLLALFTLSASIFMICNHFDRTKIYYVKSYIS